MVVRHELEERLRAEETRVVTRRLPVAWLSPRQLARTGWEVAQSSLFARFADKRDVEASTPEHGYDLSEDWPDDAPYVFDYVADTGDGFDPTFAVAAALADGVTDPAVAAQLLVFGGDLVYPVASVKEYEDRLVGPYASALRQRRLAHQIDALTPDPAAPADPTAPAEPLVPEGPRIPGVIAPEPDGTSAARAPYVLAIPGNHDWYDGLAAFRRLLCESWVKGIPSGSGGKFVLAPKADSLQGDLFAEGWSAIQSRSYWAAKLPHGWWVWGIDIQLDAPIDAAQLAYFRRAAQALAQDDCDLIVCTARPSWVDDPSADTPYWQSNKQNLVWFLHRTLGPEHRSRLRLLLSGDKHHYTRYTRNPGQEHKATQEAPDAERGGGVLAPEHLVTCGSGGAYLSSTHHSEHGIRMRWWPSHDRSGADVPPDVDYTMRCAVPAPEESRRIGAQWWRAVTKNTVWLPLTLMALYALLEPAVARVAPLFRLADEAPAWAMPWTQAVLALAAAVGGLAVYGNVKREQQPWWKGAGLGALHGLVHVLLAALAWASPTLLGIEAGAGALVVRVLAAVLLGGVGTVVVAVYYRVADRLDMQHNDAFSGLQVVDHKGHLRLTAHPDRLDVELRGITTVMPGRTAAEYVSSFVRLDGFSVRRGQRHRSGTASDKGQGATDV